MQNINVAVKAFFILTYSLSIFCTVEAQMITGVWHGRIDRQKVEVKIIQNGDSLTGTSYYFESPANYRRYTIKGYFDANDNSTVWWDDQLIEDKTRGLNLLGKVSPAMARADFNCPGGGVMKLDGKTYRGANQQVPKGDVHLEKVIEPSFNDEWDFVIDNYTRGGNDPDIIDSIGAIAFDQNHQTTNEQQVPQKMEPVNTIKTNNDEVVANKPITSESQKHETMNVPVVKRELTVEPKIHAPTIEQKFTSREKIFNKEIPLQGDSIELDFYDNAEVDGDSISLFLNGKLIFEHIRLTEKAYVVKLPIKEMPDDNELTMVAENLGTIPPNTSYMVALVANKRYDAQLASTENSSAMIRLKKESGKQ